ncbi:hypothetical protein ACFY1S_23760 [Micromonospora sp. NPDC000663]|uniref:hypothetical protein n=1 Tax=Micromonospora sp. NPDC000663 TaxID=3364218 RepID=UPI0036AE3A21
MLKKVGFFPELDPKRAGETGEPSIHASVRAVGEADEERILQYLDSGHMIIPVMEGGPDVITGEYGYEEASGCSSWISDGAWVWRYDLAHYLRRHHVELSADFLSHVRSSGYIIPPLSDEEMLELADQLAADWKR